MISENTNNDQVFIPISLSSAISSATFTDTEQDFFQHVVKLVSEAAKAPKSYNELHDLLDFDDFLELLSNEHKRVILLVDGLGWLLEKVGTDFWWKMRASVQYGSLVFVAFSRLAFQQLYENTTDKMTSPFVNVLFSYALTPFSEEQTIKLIDTYSEKNYFTPKDKRVIWQLSGGHPFLAQISASLIWEKRVNTQPVSKFGYSSLFDETVELAKPHFWDTWRYLSPSEQTIGLMLSIRDLAQITNFDTSELDNVLKQYQKEIYTLKQTGLLRVESEKVY